MASKKIQCYIPGVMLQTTVMHFFYQSLFFFSGCPVAIKRVGSSKRIALAAAAMMAMDSDVTQGPSVSSAHPLHLLSLSPIKLPFLMTPHAGRRTTENAFISVLVLMIKNPQRSPIKRPCPKGSYPSSSFGN